MVDVTKAMESDFLTVETVKSLEKLQAVILSEGSYEKTDYGEKLSLMVQIEKNREKIWRPNKSSVENLASSWGRDSKLWVGKTANLNIVKIQGKECILAIAKPDEIAPRNTDEVVV